MTNVDISTEHYHGGDKKLIEGVLKRFGAREAMEFFEGLGVVCRVEDDGKVYPASYQASSVLDVLRMECQRLGVEEHTKCHITAIENDGEGVLIKMEGNQSMRADAIIAAFGGCASGTLGSNGSGFDVLKALGHTCTPVRPALVQIKTDTIEMKSLEGIKCVSEVKIFLKSVQLANERGEVLFTKYGLSGPPILQLSIALCDIESIDGVFAAVDLFPDMSEETLCDAMCERAETQGHKPIEAYWTGWLNKRVGMALFKASGIRELSRPCRELSRAQLRSAAKKAKDWRVKVHGTMPFSQAQVTAGGINLTEFDEVLQSKIVPKLFACGELLDVHGDCGGYNLQWAWASGFIAGQAAARKIMNKSGTKSAR